MPSEDHPPLHLIAFAGFQRIAEGARDDVLAHLRERNDDIPFIVFDADTGEQLDFDLRSRTGTLAPLSGAETTHDDAPRGVGRPKLGVVAREVTLLPRHWDWLNRQPGGASVALRRLVQDASRVHAERDIERAAREAAYRFMTAIAGALPGFEEATRALFAADRERFERLVAAWPIDLKTQLQKLSAASWTHNA